MKPAIDPKNVAALFDTVPTTESKKFIHNQEQLELMDAEVVPFFEQNLFTFDSYQYLDPNWKPSNEFEEWVDTKLLIRYEAVKVFGEYTITLNYLNGFLETAFVMKGGSVYRYSQMEIGWTRQY